MNLKRLFSVEALVVAVCLIGLLATGAYLLNSHPEVQKVAVKEENWGFVRPQGPDVRVRGESETTWNKVHRDQNIFRNDRIFTGNSSTAKVNLKSTQNFTVEPNSLVVISDQAQTSTIDVDQGSFLGELRKGARLLVKSKGQEVHIESDGGTIRLEATDEKKVNLIVLKGEASVRKTAASAPQAVKANEEAKIDETAVEIHKLDISLSSPEAGAVLWDRGTSLSFAWQIGDSAGSADESRSGSGGGVGPASTRIEIARDPLFKDMVVREKIQGVDFSSKLSPGFVYFWRVVGDGQRTSTSPVSSFSYYSVKAPNLPAKANLDVVANWRGELNEPANFSWSDPSSSENYEIQISKDDDFHRLEAREVTTESSIAISGLQIGKYYWRVISKHSAREDLTSDVAEIEFTKHVEAEPVRKLAEAPPETVPETVPSAALPPVVASATAEPTPELKIEATPAPTPSPTPSPGPTASPTPQPTPLATPQPTPEPTPSATPVPTPVATPEPTAPPLLKPQLTSSIRVFELSQKDLKSSESKSILIGPTLALSWLPVEGAEGYRVRVAWADKSEESMVQEPKWFWKRPRLGKVNVSVVAIRGSEASAETSAEMNVILAAPLMGAAAAETAKEDAKPTVAISWISHKLASHTEIQISNDAKFSAPEKVNVEGESASLPMNEPGVKYFRLRSLNGQGWPVSRYSQVASVDIATVVPPEPTPSSVEPTPLPPVEAAQVQAAAVNEDAPNQNGHLLITGGIGFGYIDFSQSGSGALDSASFGSTASPVVDARVDAEFARRWGMGFEYRDLSSQPQASAGMPVSSASFHWKTISLDGKYTVYESGKSKYAVLFGVQKETIPFFSVDQHGTGSVGTNELDNLMIGGEYVYHGMGNFDYSADLRLEYPIASSAIGSDQYQATAMPMVDGSVGVTRRFGKHIRIGLIWFGQYIHSTYTSSRQGIPSNGSQTLMNSNFQLRFGYDFLGIFTMRSLFCWPRRRKKYLDMVRKRDRWSNRKPK